MIDREISERAGAERLRQIRADLLVRLRPVCGGMPQDLFVEMIEGMAALQLKYEMQEADYSATASDQVSGGPAAPGAGSDAGARRTSA